MNPPEAKSVRNPGAFKRVRRRQCRVTLVLFGIVTLAFGLLASSPTAAQTDTTATRTLAATHSPQRALWRAVAVPGWGQYYNRQYLKIPLVYVGLGGFTAAALYTNSRYLLYRRSYLYTVTVDENGEQTFPPEFADEYEQLLADLGLGPASELSEADMDRLEPQFRAQRDNLRRNRDLLYFGIVFWYGLTVLDAFVSAHLLDFDVGEDLTVTLLPHPTASGLTATLRWGF